MFENDFDYREDRNNRERRPRIDGEEEYWKPKKLIKVNVERRCAGKLVCYDRAIVVNDRVMLPDPTDERGRKKLGHVRLLLQDKTTVLVPDTEVVGWFSAG